MIVISAVASAAILPVLADTSDLATAPLPPPEIVIVLVAPVPEATTPLPVKLIAVATVANGLPSS